MLKHKIKIKKKKKIVTAITETSPAQPRTCQDPPTKNSKQILLFTPITKKKKKTRSRAQPS